jgi:hypothetical protein
MRHAVCLLAFALVACSRPSDRAAEPQTTEPAALDARDIVRQVNASKDPYNFCRVRAGKLVAGSGARGAFNTIGSGYLPRTQVMVCLNDTETEICFVEFGTPEDTARACKAHHVTFRGKFTPEGEGFLITEAKLISFD